jgi:hypothetical protein
MKIIGKKFLKLNLIFLIYLVFLKIEYDLKSKNK